MAELERRLSRSSRNSSLPPSQDPPSAPPRPRRPGSGRMPGGQPGHEGKHRRLLPPEQVDEIVEHWPERCHACAHVFAEQELVDAVEPWRHQVAELPAIAVRVSEHRLHGVCCPECATATRAELPREQPRSAFGPRLQAAVVTLAVRHRVSRRDTTELARELFGVELATGSVDAIVQRTGAALAAGRSGGDPRWRPGDGGRAAFADRRAGRGESAARGSGGRARAAAEPQLAQLVAAAVAGSAVRAAAATPAGLRSDAGRPTRARGQAPAAAPAGAGRRDRRALARALPRLRARVR